MYSQEVLRWQNFLIGFFNSINQSLDNFVADGLMGPKTKEATKAFQKRVSIPETGEVDKKTKEAASDYGFGAIVTGYPESNGVISLTSEDRDKLFGKFSYVAAATSNNPEGIKITDNWVAGNIVSVQIPGLEHLLKNKISVHKNAAPQFIEFFSKVKERGLNKLILTWDGCWNPRFVRGSRTRLSNHSLGTAFDINAAWNPLGANPAPKGSKGSVIELVPLANECGLYWGGHYPNRKDGMHFEIGKKV